MAPVEGADFVDLTEDRGSGATLFSADQDNICSPGLLSALYGPTSLVSLTSHRSVSVLADMLVTNRKKHNTSLPVGSARFICLHEGAKIKLSLTSSADQGIYNCHRGPRSINRLDGRKCLNRSNWVTQKKERGWGTYMYRVPLPGLPGWQEEENRQWSKKTVWRMIWECHCSRQRGWGSGRFI